MIPFFGKLGQCAAFEGRVISDAQFSPYKGDSQSEKGGLLARPAGNHDPNLRGPAAASSA